MDNKKIEIKLNLLEKEYKNTDNFSCIACSINDDSPEDMHKLAILKDCLEKVGIHMEAVRYEETDILSFNINFETFNKVTNRGAGRKKDCSMNKRYKSCTVAELKTRLETMKKCDIIAELGCPKQTFYRILKNIDWEESNMSIWDFTS